MTTNPYLKRLEDFEINKHFPDVVQALCERGIASLGALADFLVSKGYKRASAFEAAKRYLRMDQTRQVGRYPDHNVSRYPYHNKVGQLIHHHIAPASPTATVAPAPTGVVAASGTEIPPLLPDNPYAECELGIVFPMVARALVMAGFRQRSDIRRIIHFRHRTRSAAKAVVFWYLHMRGKPETYPFANMVGREIARHPAFAKAWSSLTAATPDQHIAAEHAALESLVMTTPIEQEITAPERITSGSLDETLYTHLINRIPKAKKQADSILTGDCKSVIARFLQTLGRHAGHDLIRIHSMTGRPDLYKDLAKTLSATDRQMLVDIGIITPQDPNILVAKFVEIYNHAKHRAALNAWAGQFLDYAKNKNQTRAVIAKPATQGLGSGS